MRKCVTRIPSAGAGMFATSTLGRWVVISRSSHDLQLRFAAVTIPCTASPFGTGAEASSLLNLDVFRSVVLLRWFFPRGAVVVARMRLFDDREDLLRRQHGDRGLGLLDDRALMFGRNIVRHGASSLRRLLLRSGELPLDTA